MKPKDLMTNTVSALTARTQFGQILRRVAEKDERFLIGRRGQPSAIIMSVRDYIRNIAPTPPSFAALRADAKRKGLDKLSMRDIDRTIAAVRRQKSKKAGKQPVR
jgi:prevent-host-death family protein